MGNSTRWTLVGILVAVNVLSNAAGQDTAIGITASAVTGIAVIALVVGYLLRRRREQ